MQCIHQQFLIVLYRSSVLKITPNTKAASPQSPSATAEPSEYLAPVPCGDYEFMNMNNLGTCRVVPPSEIRRTSSDTSNTLTRITKKHSKYSHSCTSWFSSSMLRYEESVGLPDNSQVIIQGIDEFL